MRPITAQSIARLPLAELPAMACHLDALRRAIDARLGRSPAAEPSFVTDPRSNPAQKAQRARRNRSERPTVLSTEGVSSEGATGLAALSAHRCAFCGKPLIGRRRHARYCSSAHRAGGADLRRGRRVNRHRRAPSHDAAAVEQEASTA